MADLRIVISDPKTGKSVQREIKEEGVKPFSGLKIGDKVRGELLDLTGYEFTLTGGSDDSGFPMRRDVQGTGKKMIFVSTGVGLKNLKGGQRIRKTVAGNTVSGNTAQINLKIEKAGKEDLFPKAEEAPKEEAKPEPKKEEPKKEEKKPEEKPKEEKKEAPKEEPKKEAPKAEEK